MPFRFSLQSVLEYRKSVERAEEIVLHRIVQQIADIHGEMRRIDQKQGTLRQQRDRELAGGVHAIHLQELDEREAKLTQAAEALRRKLETLEINRQKQLAVLQEARRDREVLSKIREERHERYDQDQLRKEQKTLDDMFLARMTSLKK